MTQQLLNLGTAPNDTTGDPLRTAGAKINDNFTELYNQAEAGSTPLLLGSVNWATLTHSGTSQNYSATGDVAFLPDGGSIAIQTSTSQADGDVVGYGFYPEQVRMAYPGEELSGTLTVGATEYSFSLTVDKVPDSDISAFTTVTGTLISSTIASNSFTPVGYNSHAAVYVSSTTSSQVKIRISGGSWIDITAIVDLEDAKDEDLYLNVGDILEVSHLSSATPEATTNTVLGVGNPATSYQFLSSAAATGILQPSITAPLNEAIEVSTAISVTSSAYSANNHAESHATSDWQASEHSDFSVIHEESLADAVNLVAWSPATLATGTLYHVRVRYDSTTYTSDWSDGVEFTTVATKVIRPDCILPANSALSVSTSPTLTSTAFVYAGAVQTHAQSQWQITVEVNDWNSAPVDHTSGSDLVSYAASGLGGSLVYKWRVRHEGSTTGWSEWSQPHIFETV
jgi:hypothetical protein